MWNLLKQMLTDRDTADYVIKRVSLDLYEKGSVFEDWPNAL